MPHTDLETGPIVVTGAASGIGRAVAAEFLAQGSEVIALDIQPTDLAGLQFIRVDLSDPTSIQEAAAQIDRPIRALCNVAGLPMTAPRELVVGVNWVGTRLLTETLLHRLGRGGLVINTASVGGRMWRSNLKQVRACLALHSHSEVDAFCINENVEPLLSYKLTKETLVAWTMQCAAEWISRGVRCNSVSPGIVQTPMLEMAMNKSGERGQKFVSKTPKVCEPAEVAKIYTLLCRPEAQILNGIDVRTDAGLSAILNTEEFDLSPNGLAQ